jgi:hypothetical protein
MASTTAIDVKGLAAELAPVLQGLLAARRSELIAAVERPLLRALVGPALTLVGWWLPVIVEIAIGLFAWKFEGMTIGQVIDALFAIRRQTPACAGALRTAKALAFTRGVAAE